MKLPRLLVCLLFGSPLLLAQAGQAAAPLFRDPAQPLELRVKDLVGRLSTEEKISLMMMDSPAVERLGIPAYHWWNEGLHGYARSGVATVFPQAIALAATWDPALHLKIGEVVSTEARARYNEEMKARGGSRIYHGLTIWSPNINIFRDPRWGRGQETYGEDPFLTGTMGVAFTQGLQGGNPLQLKTVATLKHYAVHSGPESQRHVFDARPSARDLWETYLEAFRMGVQEGRARSIMSVYNAIDGVPGPVNQRTLDTILRKRWGFEGAVVGDVDTVADVWSSHKYAKDAAEASALAVKAGNDLCSGDSYKALPKALQEGLLTVADIDKALSRLLDLRFRLGQFDPVGASPYDRLGQSDIATQPSSRLALQAARESIVLLKNDGVLPWAVNTLRSVAVLGPVADNKAALLGNYAGTPAAPVTLLDGLRSKLEGKGVKVVYEPAVPLVAGFAKDEEFEPGTLFSTASKETPGLRFEVFDLSGEAPRLVSDQTDSLVSRHWNSYTFVGDVPQRHALLRWTGVIVAPVDGEYTFVLDTDSDTTLQLDGKTLVQAGALTETKTYVNTFKLAAGQPCPVMLEFRQRRESDRGQVQLRWRRPIPAGAYEAALAAARAADQVVLTLGITPELEGEEMPVKLEGFEGGDRSTLQLPAVQRRLLEDVAALGKPVTVVLTTGSALILDTRKANAVLCAWYYGQNGGDALAEILLGETNPSGRLPVTFYASDTDLPAFTDYSMEGRTYRYFAGKPLYAFGHGLSYTHYGYEGLQSPALVHKNGGGFEVRVTVRNLGALAGDEVVQVYASEKGERKGRALKQLIAFQRVHLEPGESRQLVLPVALHRLSHWDEAAGDHRVEPTDYELSVGPSSDRAVLTRTLSVRPQS